MHTTESKLPIGIFGGTFDPIHLGHIHLAKKVAALVPLSELFFVPCKQSPLRAMPEVSAYERLKMVQLAIREQQNPTFIADDRESKRPGLSYSIETARSFRNQFGPEKSLCLIIAMDAFLHFTHWHRWQQILQNVHIIVANRGQYEPPRDPMLLQLCQKHVAQNPLSLHTKAAGYIFFIDIAPLPIAATQIRTAIKNGENVAKLLPESVYKYITDHKLYQK